jgi:methylmalonyl-CoA mutase N-terminal domain/subunit
MDETLALPSEKAVKIALRTQQIIAYETGVPNTIDPLAGSYFVEALTTKMEEEAEQYFARIDALGGVIPALEAGFFQREIADAAYRYQRELDAKEKVIVGVNEFVETEERIEIPILVVPPEVEIKQRKRLADVRQSRNSERVEQSLAELRQAAVDQKNLVPPLLECTRNYVTLGEMCAALVEVFGLYEEPAVF